MNRQTLISIVIGFFVMIPVIYLMQQQAKEQADYRAKLAKYKHDLAAYSAKHPKEAKPGDATAPLASQAPAAAHTDGTAPAGTQTPERPEIAAKTDEKNAPPARADFLKKLEDAKQPPKFELAAPEFLADLDPLGGALDTLSFTKVRESSFKPTIPEEKKSLDPYRPLHIYSQPGEKVVRSFALTSRSEEGLDEKPWLHSMLPGGGHRFERVLPDGDLVVRKDFIPTDKDNEFHFTLRITVENKGTQERRFGYTLVGPAGLVEPQSARMWGVNAVVCMRDAQNALDLKRDLGPAVIKAEAENKPTLSGQASPAMGLKIAYFGLDTKYFAAMVVPQEAAHMLDSVKAVSLPALVGHKVTPAEEKAAAREDSIAKQPTLEAMLSEFVVPAGATISQDYLVFVGPRSKPLLEDNALYAKNGLEDLIDYTSRLPGAESLAKLLTLVLVAFHALTRSWGLSIILLTLVVRAAMHPLMVRQLRSSTKMQMLAPEMTRLKSKYEGKDGKMSPEGQKHFQAEQWELYKKHGVNPLGCMGPMLLQLPIFYGLYNALGAAYELRQSSFLWIKDLSEPDVVTRLPFTLPMHGTNALCILPIVMLVVYILQMQTMPKPADSQAAEQQKIMNWMMPLMGYMFYMVPSGLLLYYITSSGLGTLEQRWIKKQLAAEEGQGKPGAAVAART